ncbi:hypothetical protein FHX74_000264 [Friedmanniella endophytica]|uniref:DUF7507 domain-containing protein n=1 Tax=Microlunatus kandeliicorticis TaxID=1759536 RepID=A0A7W3IP51_9ACTN|nr:hypothetical protein [Microlunatus kandeliicorticis]MBA8792670.1 hypothetical protein [Microlunatus kandeliicorticis]
MAIDKPATVNAVRVQVTGQKSITSKAQGPGEVAGPAVALTFTVTNTGNRRVGLSTVVINVSDAAGAPASQMTASPARPFSGSLAPGAKATGVYVYNIAQSARGKIRIEVSVAPTLPTVVFVGRAI